MPVGTISCTPGICHFTKLAFGDTVTLRLVR